MGSYPIADQYKRNSLDPEHGEELWAKTAQVPTGLFITIAAKDSPNPGHPLRGLGSIKIHRCKIPRYVSMPYLEE